MIQRRQTLYLLLATVAALLSFMFPFLTGKELVKGVTSDISLKAGSRFLILLLTGASLVLSATIIFLYNNRKQQMLLCWLGLVISVLIIVLYILEMNKISKPTLALSCIFPFVIPACYFLAYRYIHKDEKLIKTLDKLR